MFDIKSFAAIVAPELNFLLTEPPSRRDFGWFCREHAYCTYLLAAIQGLELRVMRGDLTFINDVGGGRTSVGEDSDHVWCMSKDEQIIDFSATLAHYADYPQLAEPITSVGTNGSYEISIFDPISLQTSMDAKKRSYFGYVPKTHVELSPFELLANPRALLSTQSSVTISEAVALHVAYMLTRQRWPIDKQLRQEDAIRQVVGAFRHPRRKLRELLEMP